MGDTERPVITYYVKHMIQIILVGFESTAHKAPGAVEEHLMGGASIWSRTPLAGLYPIERELYKSIMILLLSTS